MKTNDLKIESLDDLFDDLEADEIIDNDEIDNTKTEEIKPGNIDNKNIKKQEKTNSPKKEEYDLQKELEAKFDELFGPMEN